MCLGEVLITKSLLTKQNILLMYICLSCKPLNNTAFRMCLMLQLLKEKTANEGKFNWLQMFFQMK